LEHLDLLNEAIVSVQVGEMAQASMPNMQPTEITKIITLDFTTDPKNTRLFTYKPLLFILQMS